MKKLEIVQKEVGGCLISYNVRLACVRKLEVIWSDRAELIIMNFHSRYRAALAAKKY